MTGISLTNLMQIKTN